MDIAKLFGRKKDEEKKDGEAVGAGGVSDADNTAAAITGGDDPDNTADAGSAVNPRAAKSAVGASPYAGTAKRTKTTKKNTVIGKKGRQTRSNRMMHTKRSFHRTAGKSLSERVHTYDIIERPVITEKSASSSERGVYAFFVRKDADKHSVADAVEALYGVRPIKVRIARKPARSRRIRVRGRERETTSVGGKKKAYIFLKKGDTIKLT